MFVAPAYHKFGQKTFKELGDPEDQGPKLQASLEALIPSHKKEAPFFSKSLALLSSGYAAAHSAVILLPGLALAAGSSNMLRSAILLGMLAQWTVVLQFCAPAVYLPLIPHRSGTLVRLANIAHILLLCAAVHHPTDAMVIAICGSFAVLYSVDRFSPRIYYAELYLILLLSTLLAAPAHCCRVILGFYYLHCGLNKLSPNFVQLATLPGLAYNSSLLYLLFPVSTFFDTRDPSRPVARTSLFCAFLPAAVLEAAGILLAFESTMWFGLAAAFSAHVGIIGLNVLPGAMPWNLASIMVLPPLWPTSPCH